VDARIITSTNRNLEDEISEGRFREDLFFRLSVFPIIIPPLRERKADIPLLAEFFTHKCSKVHRKNIRHIPAQTMKSLENYGWPGNVRELMNVIERAVIVTQGPNSSLPRTQRPLCQTREGGGNREYGKAGLQRAQWSGTPAYPRNAPGSGVEDRGAGGARSAWT
jgi:transcriptional regulator with GAF, ATPase, and Fis domain